MPRFIERPGNRLFSPEGGGVVGPSSNAQNLDMFLSYALENAHPAVVGQFKEIHEKSWQLFISSRPSEDFKKEITPALIKAFDSFQFIPNREGRAAMLSEIFSGNNTDLSEYEKNIFSMIVRWRIVEEVTDRLGAAFISDSDAQELYDILLDALNRNEFLNGSEGDSLWGDFKQNWKTLVDIQSFWNQHKKLQADISSAQDPVKVPLDLITARSQGLLKALFLKDIWLYSEANPFRPPKTETTPQKHLMALMADCMRPFYEDREVFFEANPEDNTGENGLYYFVETVYPRPPVGLSFQNDPDQVPKPYTKKVYLSEERTNIKLPSGAELPPKSGMKVPVPTFQAIEIEILNDIGRVGKQKKIIAAPSDVVDSSEIIGSKVMREAVRRMLMGWGEFIRLNPTQEARMLFLEPRGGPPESDIILKQFRDRLWEAPAFMGIYLLAAFRKTIPLLEGMPPTQLWDLRDSPRLSLVYIQSEQKWVARRSAGREIGLEKIGYSPDVIKDLDYEAVLELRERNLWMNYPDMWDKVKRILAAGKAVFEEVRKSARISYEWFSDQLASGELAGVFSAPNERARVAISIGRELAIGNHGRYNALGGDALVKVLNRLIGYHGFDRPEYQLFENIFSGIALETLVGKEGPQEKARRIIIENLELDFAYTQLMGPRKWIEMCDGEGDEPQVGGYLLQKWLESFEIGKDPRREFKRVLGLDMPENRDITVDSSDIRFYKSDPDSHGILHYVGPGILDSMGILRRLTVEDLIRFAGLIPLVTRKKYENVTIKEVNWREARTDEDKKWLEENPLDEGVNQAILTWLNMKGLIYKPGHPLVYRTLSGPYFNRTFTKWITDMVTEWFAAAVHPSTKFLFGRYSEENAKVAKKDPVPLGKQVQLAHLFNVPFTRVEDEYLTGDTIERSPLAFWNLAKVGSIFGPLSVNMPPYTEDPTDPNYNRIKTFFELSGAMKINREGKEWVVIPAVPGFRDIMLVNAGIDMPGYVSWDLIAQPRNLDLAFNPGRTLPARCFYMVVDDLVGGRRTFDPVASSQEVGGGKLRDPIHLHPTTFMRMVRPEQIPYTVHYNVLQVYQEALIALKKRIPSFSENDKTFDSDISVEMTAIWRNSDRSKKLIDGVGRVIWNIDAQNLLIDPRYFQDLVDWFGSNISFQDGEPTGQVGRWIRSCELAGEPVKKEFMTRLKERESVLEKAKQEGIKYGGKFLGGIPGAAEALDAAKDIPSKAFSNFARYAGLPGVVGVLGSAITFPIASVMVPTQPGMVWILTAVPSLVGVGTGIYNIFKTHPGSFKTHILVGEHIRVEVPADRHALNSDLGKVAKGAGLYNSGEDVLQNDLHPKKLHLRDFEVYDLPLHELLKAN